MSALRHYAVVTVGYWAFTLTDGALRTLVLLHFNQLGYTPFQLATTFLLYESAGVVANIVGGWLATRFGIPRMLATGMALQIAGLGVLSALDPAWPRTFAIAWVVVAQGIAGIAKDITKTAAKSALKATALDTTGTLFRWVAWFTGSKNAMKGAGYFLGGVLLATIGFRHALWLMIVLLAATLVAVATALPRRLGIAKASRTMRELFAKSRAVNVLAAARLCLFGARDVWFVVGLPVFLYGQGWTYTRVAGFLALWTIGYGIVQALAPLIVRRRGDDVAHEVAAIRTWGLVLTALPVLLAMSLQHASPIAADTLVVAGLCAFGIVFAVMSSLHSYLILAYAGSEKAAEDVGFYYAANACGRLLGIVLSGWLTGLGGLAACLWGAAAMLGVCSTLTWLLPRATPIRCSADLD